jgi:hypothetical protein
MTPEIEKLIERLKTARTVPEMAQATALVLRACGIWNFQAVAQELARMCVVGG